MPNCFVPANILLPDEEHSLSQWACLACDQFTSQPEYWQKAEAWRREPSAPHLVLPEVYLGKPGEAERIAAIQANMKGIPGCGAEPRREGLCVCGRDTGCGPGAPWPAGRSGSGAVQLHPRQQPGVRPTENTVVERIPPAGGARGASLSCPM